MPSPIRGRCWNWPAGVSGKDQHATEDPHHVPPQPRAPPRLTSPPPLWTPQWQDLPTTQQEELLRLFGRMLAGQLAVSAEEESDEQR
jgi:hypothetical protein